MTKTRKKPPSRRQRRRHVSASRRRTEAHLGMTIEDWRIKKRQEWRVVLDALQAFQFGAAYTPAGPDLYTVTQCADRIAATLAEDWVCW